jgi:hypothetical protein
MLCLWALDIIERLCVVSVCRLYFKIVQNVFKSVQNVFKSAQNVFKSVQNVFKSVKPNI